MIFFFYEYLHIISYNSNIKLLFRKEKNDSYLQRRLHIAVTSLGRYLSITIMPICV